MTVLVAAVVVVLVGALVWFVFVPAASAAHRHRWEVRETSDGPVVGIDNSRTTHVLYVCEVCGKPRTKRVKGVWTVADLQSKRERERDMDALRDMVNTRDD